MVDKGLNRLYNMENLLEALKERQRVCSGTGKTDQHLTVVQLPDLRCPLLEHRILHSDLSVAAHGDFIVTSYREDCC